MRSTDPVSGESPEDAMLLLRYLVVRLGELQGWWSTTLYRPEAARSLAMLFPRTPLLAAYHAASAVACETHDARVGSRRHHLFRLTPALEGVLERRLRGARPLWVNQPDTGAHEGGLLERLDQLAASDQVVEADTCGSPVSLGPSPRRLSTRTVAILAKHYAVGARARTCALPYLDAVPVADTARG